MKRPKDMTREELQALPLASSFEEEITTDSKTGHTIRIRLPTKLRLCGVEPDDLAFWSDVEGSWTPVYIGPEEGWAKEPMILQ